jgi:hypothetical protein
MEARRHIIPTQKGEHIMFHEQIETVLSAAEVILQRKEKIELAINGEVAGLSGLIAERLATEREFRKLECQAAIGGPASGLKEARKSVADAQAALDSATAKLGGYRMQLGEMGTDLVRDYEQLAAELPQYNARIIGAFAEEWAAALASWSQMLGRRAAIEGVLGQSLDLPDPVAVPAELGDLARPHETVTALSAAIKSIARAKSISERPLKSGTFYDPTRIYKLVSDRWESQGLPKGTFVVDASFEPGRLAQILEFEEARPILDRDQIPGVTVAAAKAAEIDKAVREREIRESELRLHAPRTEPQTTRRYDLEKLAERADDSAERALKYSQIAGRSIGPNDRASGAH